MSAELAALELAAELFDDLCCTIVRSLWMVRIDGRGEEPHSEYAGLGHGATGRGAGSRRPSNNATKAATAMRVAAGASPTPLYPFAACIGQSRHE
jgi:hypothetical protein